MASKRRIKRRCCTNKIRYPDKITAKNAVFKLRRKFERYKYKWFYHCKFCNGYHIGDNSKYTGKVSIY